MDGWSRGFLQPENDYETTELGNMLMILGVFARKLCTKTSDEHMRMM